ncbi:MAG: hypothetical protein MI862_03490 [Desulfobacterales bacterium]|nr:hypothetical protein [Desulfobacterales bacterium]
MGPGPLIAIDVILLYLILGPLVLFAIYLFFDSLGYDQNEDFPRPSDEKTPELWNNEDIEIYLDQK